MNSHARIDHAPIPFIDVQAQRRRLGKAIDDAVARVMDHCQFLMGPEVNQRAQSHAAFKFLFNGLYYGAAAEACR